MSDKNACDNVNNNCIVYISNIIIIHNHYVLLIVAFVKIFVCAKALC